jgi:hypothetical protein
VAVQRPKLVPALLLQLIRLLGRTYRNSTCECSARYINEHLQHNQDLAQLPRPSKASQDPGRRGILRQTAVSTLRAAPKQGKRAGGSQEQAGAP